MENILFELVKKIPENIRWCLGGSWAMKLQDFDCVPDDIDIIAPYEDALKIKAQLSFLKEKVPFGKNPKGVFDSYYGQYVKDDVAVDLIGDFCIKDKYIMNKNHKCWDRVVNKKFHNLNIPVLSVEDLFLFYFFIPEYGEKAETIAKSRALDKKYISLYSDIFDL